MFNLLIRFLICISLTFCPTWSFAQAAPEEQELENIRQEQLGIVNNYNQKVDSLFEHTFGPRTSFQFYANHPLDFYSLIGQNVYLLNTKGFRKRETIVKYAENIADLQQQETLKVNPQFNYINPNNLFIEVIKINESTEIVEVSESSNKTKVDTADTRAEIAEAVINTKGDSIRGVLSQEMQNNYTGNTHIVQDKSSRYTFNISYQGKVLHSFSNNVLWMSFFGNYLIFMEGSQVYENKANLSFIDLTYFRSAIGKTALPVFRIPISIDSPEKADMLMNPSEILIDKDSFVTRGGGTEYTVSKVQMNEIAKTQHFIFNILVSLLSIDRYSRDMLPFFKEIAHYAKELLQRTQKSEPDLITTKQKRDSSESQKIVEQITAEILKTRVDLGTPSHHTGHYGQVKAAQSRLGDFQLNEVDKEALDKSLKHLEKDKSFQQALQDLYLQKFGKRKIFERIKGLWAQLSLPQPLGAAKIQSALGLIANSVRPGGTVENRFKALTEGIYQLSAHKKRMIALPVLAGMAGFAAPEAAELYTTTISYVGQTLGEVGSVLTKAKELKSIVDMPQAYNTYAADGKIIPSSIGLASVFGAMLLLVYSLHIPINTMRFVKYLKTQRAYEHQHSADTHRRSFWEHFKAFTSETKNTYFKNLAHGEFKKLGMPATFTLPDNSNVEMAFQTMERLSSIVEDYKNTEFTIHLKVNINEGEKRLHFISSPEENREQDRFTLKLSTANTTATRHFFLAEGIMTDMFEDNLLRNNPSIEIHVESNTSKINSLYTGNLINHSFTTEEKIALEEALTETKYQKTYDSILHSIIRKKEHTGSQEPADLTAINLSETEVKNIAQALKIFFLDLSTFANTEYVKVTIWNYWFLIRTFIIDPRALVTFSIFPNYFNRVYSQSHTPTAFNNGNHLRFTNTIRRLYPSGREYLSALKQFEAEIIPIERQYLRAVAEYTYLIALKRSINKENQIDSLIASGVQKQAGTLSFLPKDDLIDKANFSLNVENLSKKDAFFLEFFQTNLFEESMRDYLKEALGITGDESIKDKKVLAILKTRLKQGIPVVLHEEPLDSIRTRVRRVADRNNTEQRTQKTMNRFYKAFLKKLRVKNNSKMEKKLNPNKSMQMERFHAAQILSKDPEAMARATRSEISKMIVDKPIELFILLSLMSGVEYGILKVLYSDSFSENSFFFLSSYLIWTVFMSKFVMDLLGGSWFKLQIDSQQAFQHGFNLFPSKEDVEKRFAALKWAWKSWNKEGRMGLNELAIKYKFMWRIVIANLRAAIVTLIVIQYATLGRIDIELIAGAFLAEAVFGQEALRYKLENSYENFNGYALKDLIKKDINIKKFLTHPVVQKILIDESFKYRLKFNVLNSLFVMNIVENFFRLVESSEVLSGSRSVYRTVIPGNSLFTEYWNKVTGYAASLPLPTGIVNFCKKIFTSNRFDLSD